MFPQNLPSPADWRAHEKGRCSVWSSSLTPDFSESFIRNAEQGDASTQAPNGTDLRTPSHRKSLMFRGPCIFRTRWPTGLTDSCGMINL